ncbi:hypothetical protein CDAR_427861 [Caerostris darwini]|uniref:Uncharacterized protein n=1 Tax=Caerostris darwini TaxID=1538125 RepID=A0AAV4QCR1_9ARAC|nr:hypothetical protein CDAR_427861 [Caerostris darwini]
MRAPLRRGLSLRGKQPDRAVASERSSFVVLTSESAHELRTRAIPVPSWGKFCDLNRSSAVKDTFDHISFASVFLLGKEKKKKTDWFLLFFFYIFIITKEDFC